MDGEQSLWTVSGLTAYIRDLFEIDFRLQQLQVEGELSNFVRARSGHLYFTLKDERAQLRCVMWRSNADRLTVLPEDGDAVVAEGRVSVYEAGGTYQLYVDSIMPAGRGSLALAFEELKHKLAMEGLFEGEHKLRLPVLPRKLGVVTSLDAAALRDIINVLRRRWPSVSVLIAPSLVQGPEAPAQLQAALSWLDGRSDIDTIIIARGGGSMEDLWAFNDEGLARAIFSAQHPVIVGVGHETDFTIADFVADVRAPTPSAAAELAVPDQVEMKARIVGYSAYLNRVTGDLLNRKRREVQVIGQSLRHLSPRASLDSHRQRVDWLGRTLDTSIRGHLERRGSLLTMATKALETVSPVATLERGYAIVRKIDDGVVRSAGDVRSKDALRITVQDGDFDAHVD